MCLVTFILGDLIQGKEGVQSLRLVLRRGCGGRLERNEAVRRVGAISGRVVTITITLVLKWGGIGRKRTQTWGVGGGNQVYEADEVLSVPLLSIPVPHPEPAQPPPLCGLVCF